MTADTHQTAPTQFVEANGMRFAYRRFGKAGGVPIVFNQHYLGTMDYWDPAVTDGLARNREVILFNNAGVSSSCGEVPTTCEEMGANAVEFIKALALTQVDVLGISIGGFVAHEITLQAPELVRKLILVGTGPRGGEGMASQTPEAQRIFGAAYDPPEHLWLAVLFGPSQKAQAAGLEFLKRKHLRQVDRDPEVNERVGPRQREAIAKWGVQREGPEPDGWLRFRVVIGDCFVAVLLATTVSRSVIVSKANQSQRSQDWHSVTGIHAEAIGETPIAGVCREPSMQTPERPVRHEDF